jgi:hypothetical protein
VDLNIEGCPIAMTHRMKALLERREKFNTRQGKPMKFQERSLEKLFPDPARKNSTKIVL